MAEPLEDDVLHAIQQRKLRMQKTIMRLGQSFAAAIVLIFLLSFVVDAIDSAYVTYFTLFVVSLGIAKVFSELEGFFYDKLIARGRVAIAKVQQHTFDPLKSFLHLIPFIGTPLYDWLAKSYPTRSVTYHFKHEGKKCMGSHFVFDDEHAFINHHGVGKVVFLPAMFRGPSVLVIHQDDSK